jgi:hypothetical protein
MRLLKKPHPWSCILSAFAMALDKTNEEVSAAIGHDGSEIIFPDLPEPMCRRGFHHQELIHAALLYGYSVTPFELIPALQSTPQAGSPPKVVTIDSAMRRHTFQILVGGFKGVLTGRGFKCHHAVAFDHGAIFDPDGDTYQFSFSECERRRFYAQCVWIVHPLDV